MAVPGADLASRDCCGIDGDQPSKSELSLFSRLQLAILILGEADLNSFVLPLSSSSLDLEHELALC
jgi:hypothetical protein